MSDPELVLITSIHTNKQVLPHKRWSRETQRKEGQVLVLGLRAPVPALSPFPEQWDRQTSLQDSATLSKWGLGPSRLVFISLRTEPSLHEQGSQPWLHVGSSGTLENTHQRPVPAVLIHLVRDPLGARDSSFSPHEDLPVFLMCRQGREPQGQRLGNSFKELINRAEKTLFSQLDQEGGWVLRPEFLEIVSPLWATVPASVRWKKQPCPASPTGLPVRVTRYGVCTAPPLKWDTRTSQTTWHQVSSWSLRKQRVKAEGAALGQGSPERTARITTPHRGHPGYCKALPGSPSSPGQENPSASQQGHEALRRERSPPGSREGRTMQQGHGGSWATVFISRGEWGPRERGALRWSSRVRVSPHGLSSLQEG